MVLTEFFDDFATLDTDRWQARTSGSGAVDATGDSTVTLDEGGAIDDDCAALVLKEALDFTKDWIFAVCVRVTGATTAAHSPNLIGIYNGAAVPGIGTQAAQDAAHRIYVENQMNVTTPANSRFQYRFKNPSATVYTWRNLNDNWSTSFAHSHTRANDDNYIILNIYHKVGSGIRVIGYGYDDEDSGTGSDSGARLIGDTDWVAFGAGATDIDAIDDDAYMVIGDLANDAGGYEHIVSVEWARLHEITGVRQEVAYAAGAVTAAFPFPYEIREYVCPISLINIGHPLFIPAEHHPPDSIVVARGANDWVQNPNVYEDTDGEQYMVYSRRVDANISHITIRSRSALGDAWGAATDIITENDDGLDVAVTQLRFVQLLKENGNWYLFFNSETATGTPMKIWRAKSANADPEVVDSWGSITEVLVKSGVGDAFDEDGVAGPYVIRFATGDYRMAFAGLDASLGGSGQWASGMASTTTVEGTWTKDAGNPIWPRSAAQTQVNGAAVSARVFNVDATAGFVVDQPIVMAAQDAGAETIYRPTRIRKVVSDTQIEVYHRVETADNQYVSAYDGFSTHVRVLRRAPDFDGWELWATVFKYANGQEVTARYVSDVGDTDPATATWTMSTDHGFPWIGLTFRPNLNFISEENICFILDVDDILIPAAVVEDATPVIVGRRRRRAG